MTTPTMFPPTPLLHLVCQNCKGDMIRFVAYGLNVDARNNLAEVVDGDQFCSTCGHSHEIGTLLRIKEGETF